MRTVTEILSKHVTLDIESVDRIYLNGYMPHLQTPGQLARFFIKHRGQPIPSPALLQRMTRAYVKAVEDFVAAHDVPVIHFKPKDDKDAIGNEMRRTRPTRDGVVFVGVAQERAISFKGTRSAGEWVNYQFSRESVYVKHYYFYLHDEDFGPVILKVGTYLPFPIKLIINGHEWAKRQLEKMGIAYESLDNGFLSCQDPETLQHHCTLFGPDPIEHLFRKWLARLPYPFGADDQGAGYSHELSVWQLEVSRTHVFDQPVHGREFFEDVIRENLDLGRPERVQLLFNRRVCRNTPGKFQTRIITNGVQPSLHITYKSTQVKQYFKDNRALRTETTINKPEDFEVNRGLKNLPYLIEIARNTNRRLLEVQKVSDDCVLSYESVQRLTQPTVNSDGQRAPGLKIDDPRVMSLLAALCLFLHLIDGFRNREIRKHIAHLLGVPPESYTAGQMTYDLRRLRLKGIISRVPNTNRYILTPYGRKVTLFVTRVHARLLRPGFAAIDPSPESKHLPLRKALAEVDNQIEKLMEASKLRNNAKKPA